MHNCINAIYSKHALSSPVFTDTHCYLSSVSLKVVFTLKQLWEYENVADVFYELSSVWFYEWKIGCLKIQPHNLTVLITTVMTGNTQMCGIHCPVEFHILPLKGISIREYVHTHTHTYTYTYIHTYLYIHTYIHTYIHAYIHGSIST